MCASGILLSGWAVRHASTSLGTDANFMPRITTTRSLDHVAVGLGDHPGISHGGDSLRAGGPRERGGGEDHCVRRDPC